MAELSKACYECHAPKEDDGLFLCQECRANGVRMTPIGVFGMSDGPGSGNKELHFDKPNPAQDIPLTLKKMEEAGHLKTPEAKRMAAIKMKVAKATAPLKTDYQKTGHPAERDD